ncbi:MAG: hypothetical protein SV375_02605 [Thermodesulfobacteriota bacterium]|nr:hypothetical protein [Thermodesulfobacteriota bacterium]
MTPKTELMIHGMEKNTARQYLAVMDKISDIADRIHALADIMSMFLEIAEGEVQIKPRTVGYIGKMITTDVMWMVSYLDNDFASSSDIELFLKNTDPHC